MYHEDTESYKPFLSISNDSICVLYILPQTNNSIVCCVCFAFSRSLWIRPSETRKTLLCPHHVTKFSNLPMFQFLFCSHSIFELFAGLIAATTPQRHTLRAHTSCNFRSRVSYPNYTIDKQIMCVRLEIIVDDIWIFFLIDIVYNILPRAKLAVKTDSFLKVYSFLNTKSIRELNHKKSL